MVTIQRTAATLLSVALLTHCWCFRAYAAASQVNFKFVDPNQAGAAQDQAGSTQGSSAAGDAAADGSPAASNTDAQTAPASTTADSDKTDSGTGSTGTTDTGNTAAPTSKQETSDNPSGTKDGGMQAGKLGVPDQDSQSETSETPAAGETPAATETTVKSEEPETGKVLQGYVRVVPSGTKVPIIMDTAIDSDTSQEGDEFSARTSEDLDIDGSTVVPAGSTIRGRVAQLNLPRRMDRSGSVALKFDTITTPDNRQIPLVANLVAHGGVVHAKRGIKDIAIDTSAVAVPTLAGLGIGLIAAKASSSSSIGAGGGALIGAGLGVAVGVAILLAKKGKKVDVRPGDELKIELAEDLRMPM